MVMCAAVIERTRDAKDVIRHNAFLWLADKCSIRNFTIGKRIQVWCVGGWCKSTVFKTVLQVGCHKIGKGCQFVCMHIHCEIDKFIWTNGMYLFIFAACAGLLLVHS